MNFLHNNLLSNFSYKKYKPFDLYGKIFIHKVQKSIIILLTIKSQIEHVNDRIIPIINAIMPIPNVWIYSTFLVAGEQLWQKIPPSSSFSGESVSDIFNII